MSVGTFPSKFNFHTNVSCSFNLCNLKCQMSKQLEGEVACVTVATGTPYFIPTYADAVTLIIKT